MIALLVAVAGGAGSAARFLVDVGWRRRWPGVGPWPIAAINIVGSFLLGVLAARLGPDSDLAVIAGAGFCGGFTTLSTASVEAAQLLRVRSTVTAAVYVVGTLALALGAAWVGSRCG